MNNVLRIFRTDLRNLFRNTVATIVTLGLIIVPPMYAWLTTLGFWDPYNNTGGLKVAVANQDAGYQSELIPVSINVGNTIVGKLHENSQFNWVFTSAENAEAGVKSGAYYAGIVIPESFSKDLLQLMMAGSAQGAEKPEFTYYVNQKVNAIASHVTATGASVLQSQINQSFAKSVSEVSVAVMHDVSQFMDGSNSSQYAGVLVRQLHEATAALDAAIVQAQGIQGAIAITSSLLTTSSQVLGSVSAMQGTADNFITNSSASLGSASDAVSNATSSLSGGISKADASIGSIQNSVNQVFQSAQNDPAYAEQLLADAATSAKNLQTVYQDARTALQAQGASAATLAHIDAAIAALGALEQQLTAAQQSVAAIASNATQTQQQVNENITSARNSIQSVNQQLSTEVAAQIAQFQENLQNVTSSSKELVSLTASAAQSLQSATGSLTNSLALANDALGQTIKVLQSAQTSLADSAQKLEAALSSGNLDKVKEIIGNDPASLASFISASTNLVTHAVYEVPNNGSSMSPFYSSLSLWVGSIFLIALTNVNVSAKQVSRLKSPKPWQLYLGRYGVFLLVALLQAMVLFVGNVFFLQVQCEHPFLYLLSLLVCALVFSNLVYTLNISFGNLGKAAAIILLVMQLAGTGGIMPIQTSAPIFQAIYPWLPFTHALTALSSSMSGIYGTQLVWALLVLLAFLVPSLLLGLVFRNPMIRANAFLTRKLDETRFL